MRARDSELERYAGLALTHEAVAACVERLRAEHATVPWWSVSRLRTARALREARAEQAGLQHRLDDDPRSRDTLVQCAIDSAVRRVRESAHRNAYHPEVRNQLDDLVTDVLARIGDDAYWAPTRYGPRTAQTPMTHVAAFADLLTRARVEAAITGRVDQLAAVADDDEMLECTDRRTYAVVQHRASGLRAAFKTDAGPLWPNRIGTFGVINSKPYRVPFLSHDPDPDSWERYVGLGIGTKVYRRGAQLLPHVRWRSSVTAPAAHGVRRHLHHDDPYIWQWAACDRCRADDDGWASRDREQVLALHQDGGGEPTPTPPPSIPLRGLP